jgi:hypothetical protein
MSQKPMSGLLISPALWRVYIEVGAPYGATTEGLARWLREQAERMERTEPPDPRMQQPL